MFNSIFRYFFVFLTLSLIGCENGSNRFVVYQKQMDQMEQQAAQPQPVNNNYNLQQSQTTRKDQPSNQQDVQFYQPTTRVMSSELYKPEPARNVLPKNQSPDQFKTEIITLSDNNSNLLSKVENSQIKKINQSTNNPQSIQQRTQYQAQIPVKTDQPTKKLENSENFNKSRQMELNTNLDKKACYLQVGIFSDNKNAENMIKKINSLNLKTLKRDIGGRVKLLVGPISGQEEVLKSKEKLESSGIKSFKVCD